MRQRLQECPWHVCYMSVPPLETGKPPQTDNPTEEYNWDANRDVKMGIHTWHSCHACHPVLCGGLHAACRCFAFIWINIVNPPTILHNSLTRRLADYIILFVSCVLFTTRSQLQSLQQRLILQYMYIFHEWWIKLYEKSEKCGLFLGYSTHLPVVYFLCVRECRRAHLGCNDCEKILSYCTILLYICWWTSTYSFRVRELKFYEHHGKHTQSSRQTCTSCRYNFLRSVTRN